MNKIAIAVLLVAQTALAQDAFKCPHEYGFYPHHRSCDKYWKCENNVAELKTCGNGLGFEASDPKFLAENCDYLHNVDCGERSELEPPQKTANCPRLYGIFHDEERCDTFWSCWNGEASRYTCAPGLAYDADARVCMWADQVPGCKLSQKDGNFACPNAKDSPSPSTFSRHAHPDDCRKYFVCLDGNPREYGCPIGTVFKIGSDDFSGQCEDPEGVEGCESYYGDEFKGIKKSQFLLGGDDGSYNEKYQSVTNKPTLRKKVPQTPKPAKVEQQTEPTQQKTQQQQNRVQSQGSRVRPQGQEKQEKEKEQPQAQQNRQRPINSQQLSQRTAPVTNRPTTTTTTTQKTTEAPKQDDEYYYYDDNYDVPAAGSNKQA